MGGTVGRTTHCCTGYCCCGCTCAGEGATISASRSWYQVPVLADMTVYLYSGLRGSGDTC